jgi:hypothetical protein
MQLANRTLFHVVVGGTQPRRNPALDQILCSELFGTRLRCTTHNCTSPAPQRFLNPLAEICIIHAHRIYVFDMVGSWH